MYYADQEKEVKVTQSVATIKEKNSENHYTFKKISICCICFRSESKQVWPLHKPFTCAVKSDPQVWAKKIGASNRMFLRIKRHTNEFKPNRVAPDQSGTIFLKSSSDD